MFLSTWNSHFQEGEPITRFINLSTHEHLPFDFQAKKKIIWDEYDERIFNVRIQKDSRIKYILTGYVTAEHGILIHEEYIVPGGFVELVHASVPTHYFLKVILMIKNNYFSNQQFRKTKQLSLISRPILKIYQIQSIQKCVNN